MRLAFLALIPVAVLVPPDRRAAQAEDAIEPVRVSQGLVCVGDRAFRPFGVALSAEALPSGRQLPHYLEGLMACNVRMILCEHAPQPLLAAADEVGLLVLDPALDLAAAAQPTHASLVPVRDAGLPLTVLDPLNMDPISPILVPPDLPSALFDPRARWDRTEALAAQRLLSQRAQSDSPAGIFVRLDGPTRQAPQPRLPSAALTDALAPLALSVPDPPLAGVAGAALTFSASVINDTGRQQDFMVSLSADALRCPQPVQVSLAPASAAQLTFDCGLPDEPQAVSLLLTAESEADHASLACQVEVLPAPGAGPHGKTTPVLCWDPLGGTLAALSAAGLTPKSVPKPSAAPPLVLVVGEEATNNLSSDDSARLWDAVAAGGRAVLLRQELAGLRAALDPIGLAPETTIPCTALYADQPSHPLAGAVSLLAQAAHGASFDCLPKRLPPGARTPLIGVISACERISDPPGIATGAVLAEVPYRSGVVLLCQAPLVQAAPADPRSLVALRDLVQYAHRWRASAGQPALVLGWETTKALRAVGFAADNLLALDDRLPPGRIMLLGQDWLAAQPGPPLAGEQGAQALRFAQHGGTLLVLSPPPGELGLAGIHVEERLDRLACPEISANLSDLNDFSNLLDWYDIRFEGAFYRFLVTDPPFLIDRRRPKSAVLALRHAVGSGQIIVLATPSPLSNDPRERYLAAQLLLKLGIRLSQ